MTIAEQVKSLIGAHFDLDPGSLSHGDNFLDDLKADSLALTELMLALEEQFEIEIDEREMSGIETVGDAIAYVRGRSVARSAS